MLPGPATTSTRGMRRGAVGQRGDRLRPADAVDGVDAGDVRGARGSPTGTVPSARGGVASTTSRTPATRAGIAVIRTVDGYAARPPGA